MKNRGLFIGLLSIIIIVVFILIAFPKLFKGDSFNIVEESIEIKVGEKQSIKYKLNGKYDINWESMDESVATVINGEVTGKKIGSTTIKATATNQDKELSDTIKISTYDGDKNIKLEKLLIHDGEIFITKGDNYDIPIEYSPTNAYIKSIDYVVEDTNIANFSEKLYTYNTGVTTLTITVNGDVSQKVTINVVNKNTEPVFASRVKSVSIEEENIVLYPSDNKKIEYTVSPVDAFIEDIKWESSDPSIAYVDDGILIAKSSGNTTIKLTIDNKITKEINVSVKVPVNKIILKSSPSISLKIGQKTSIASEVSPLNATNKKINYSSSNSCVSIDANGVVTAMSQGSGNITLKADDGNAQLSIPFIVYPQKGVINGDGGIWGYTSEKDVTPLRAESEFFTKLASSGKGTISDNVYKITDGGKSYSYNISRSRLELNNRETLMRIYYPQGVDLSTVNTFTFMGGTGELNFSSFFSSLNKDPSLMKSSGIIILVSGKDGYSALDAINATSFVKSIVGQKDGVKNTIGGYSLSGSAAGKAANDDMYDRLIIFDSYISDVQKYTNLVNKEIIFYSPSGDKLADKTKLCLNQLIKYNFSNVTVVTNNTSMVTTYGSNFLVINPGEPMGTGHLWVNITNANVFAYGCS